MKIRFQKPIAILNNDEVIVSYKRKIQATMKDNTPALKRIANKVRGKVSNGLHAMADKVAK